MLEVGVNSYITIEEADNYITLTYEEFDSLAIRWTILSERDKVSLLIKSVQQIEALVLPGRKVFPFQDLQFPRIQYGQQRLMNMMGITGQIGIVPKQVKDAQAENALGLLKERLARRSDEQIKTMASLGATSNWKYSKRNQGDVGLGEGLTGKADNKRLSSQIAEQILKSWIGG